MMKKGIGILAASNKHGLSLTVESEEIYGKHASVGSQTWGSKSTQDMEGFKHQTQLMLSTHLYGGLMGFYGGLMGFNGILLGVLIVGIH